MELGKRIAARLEGATFDRVAAAGLANARRNQPWVGRSILELREVLGEGEAAIVVSAGPSLHRRRSLDRLRESRFPGLVVAVDGALGACLRAGVVPHLVVSVDPHPGRIVRWFGDPGMTGPPEDDYFRRQEMDPVHAADEVRANRDLVELVDRHAAGLRVAVATSASPAVVERCRTAGMSLFWWNPMYDDHDQPESVSRQLYRLNRLPCLNGGGNVGTAAWVLTHAVLGRRRIALVGMDFSYPPGTPYTHTQYYPELRELFGDRFVDAFVHLDSPYLGERWFTDPAYYWFRDVFLGMAANADAETINCTEGGILAGPSVPMAPLDDFLAKTRP
jgi:hypothetical protein